MLKVIIFAGLALAVWAATTVVPTGPMILYDMKHVAFLKRMMTLTLANPIVAFINVLYKTDTIASIYIEEIQMWRLHKAMIVVVGDGCYEYHMNHQDVLDSQDPAMKVILEARMLQELSMAINKVETGHHHIDHMTQEIKTACASLPVFSWDLAMATDSPIQ